MAKVNDKRELRYADPDSPMTAGDEGRVDGYAVVYDKPADIGGMWTEYIDRGALDGCNLKDVQFLVNHNGQGITLARSRRNTKNSTMRLTPDEKGLRIEADLDVENNQEARALHSAIKRGDITGMSFRFVVDDDEWLDLKTSHPVRHIKRIAYIEEVSAVNSPAYPATSITARSLDSEGVLERARAALDSAGTDELELEKAKIEILFNN